MAPISLRGMASFPNLIGPARAGGLHAAEARQLGDGDRKAGHTREMKVRYGRQSVEVNSVEELDRLFEEEATSAGTSELLFFDGRAGHLAIGLTKEEGILLFRPSSGATPLHTVGAPDPSSRAGSLVRLSRGRSYGFDPRCAIPREEARSALVALSERWRTAGHGGLGGGG